MVARVIWDDAERFESDILYHSLIRRDEHWVGHEKVAYLSKHNQTENNLDRRMSRPKGMESV